MISSVPFSASERRLVAALTGIYSFRMLGLFMVLPLLGVYAVDLPGATPQTLGFAMGAYGLTQAALQIPLGWLSDRIGRRPVILAGLLSFIAGSLVAGGADTIYGIILGRFLQGAGAIAAALGALAADGTREIQRTKAMAAIGASVGLSFALALVLGPLIASIGGLSLVFYVTAVFGATGFLLVAFVLPPVQQDFSGNQGRWEVAHVMNGGLPIVYGSVFLLHAVLMATFLVVPRVLTDDLGLSPDHHWVSYLLTVVLSVPPAFLLMKRGRTDGDPRWVMLIAIASLMGGTSLAVTATELWVLGLGLVCFFIGVNTLEAVLPAVVSRLAPSAHRGTAMGLFATSQFLGIFVGGTAGGVILGAGGVMAMVSVVLVAALVWAIVVINLRLNPAIPVASGD